MSVLPHDFLKSKCESLRLQNEIFNEFDHPIEEKIISVKNKHVYQFCVSTEKRKS